MPALSRDGFYRDRHFPGARNTDHLDILRAGAAALQCIQSAGEQPLGDSAVEARDHDGEPQTARVQMAFDHLRSHLFSGNSRGFLAAYGIIEIQAHHTSWTPPLFGISRSSRISTMANR